MWYLIIIKKGVSCRAHPYFFLCLTFILAPLIDGDLTLDLKTAPVSVSASEDRSRKYSDAIDTLVDTPVPEDIVAITEMTGENRPPVLLVEPIKTINFSKIESSSKVSLQNSCKTGKHELFRTLILSERPQATSCRRSWRLEFWTQKNPILTVVTKSIRKSY